MHNDSRERMLGNPVFKLLRWTVPWVALAVVVFYLWGFWSDFQTNKAAIVVTTAEEQAMRSAEETSSTPVVGLTLVALVDGLKLRTNPASTGQTVASVGKDTKLVVLEKKGDWFRVKDPLGRIGWVTSSAQFVQQVVTK